MYLCIFNRFEDCVNTGIRYPANNSFYSDNQAIYSNIVYVYIK